MLFNLNAQTFEIFRKLTILFNSHYRMKLKVQNYLDNQFCEATFFSQFLPVYRRFSAAELRVGYWRLNAASLQMMRGITSDFIGYAADHDEFDLYIPELLNEYLLPITSQLPPASQVFVGFLTPSGRSLWLDPGRKSGRAICLKLDTLKLELPLQFISKILDARQIEHSTEVSRHLEDFSNVLEEKSGLQLNVNGLPVYRYLERNINFKEIDLRRDDALIPMHAFVSQEFWADAKLLETLGLEKKSLSVLFYEDLAGAFADFIKYAFEKSFIHLEMHQQNLTVHIRSGRILKIIYHDLLDSVFDPISFFLTSESRNQCDEKMNVIRKLTKNDSFNPENEVRNFERKFYDFNIVGLYRRYIRNFGEYSKIANVLQGLSPFASRKFEAALLEKMNFSESDLKIEKFCGPLEGSDATALKSDLYWCMDLFHKNKQLSALTDKLSLLESLKSQITTEGAKIIFESQYFSQRGVASAGFPVHPSAYEAQLLKQIFCNSEKYIFWGQYNDLPFLVIFI